MLQNSIRRKQKAIKCHCGEIAEVLWISNGEEHKVCANCMSRYWNMITEKYKGSNALEASIFKEIRW